MGIFQYLTDKFERDNQIAKRQEFAQQNYADNPKYQALALNPEMFDKLVAANIENDDQSAAASEIQNIISGKKPSALASVQPTNIMPQEQSALSQVPDLATAIKGFEGYSPKAKWDYKQDTNGYGTKANYAGEQIDPQEAESRLNNEIGKVQQSVEQFAPNAPQGVKSALASLTYNVGSGWKNAGLGKAIKAGDYDTAKDIFLQYNKAGGQVLPGLVNRRQQESQWFDNQPEGSALAQVASAQPQTMNDGQPSALAKVGAPQNSPTELTAPPTQQATVEDKTAQAEPSAGKMQTIIDQMLVSKNKRVRDKGLALQEKYLQKQFDNEDAPPEIKTVDNKDGSKTSVQWDRAQRKFVPIKLDGQSQTDEFEGLVGEDYLKALEAKDPGQAGKLKAILEGRAAPPTGNRAGGAAGQHLLDQLARAEPGFDNTLWKSRNETRNYFAKGKGAENVASFNTAIGHLDTLAKAAKDLNNSNIPGGSWARMATNPLAATLSPDFEARRNKFNVAKDAVASELTRAFRGTGGNVHDLVEWKKNLDDASSETALKASIQQATELLGSRIEALGDQYNKGMRTDKNPAELLSPKAQKILANLEGGEEAGETVPDNESSEIHPQAIEALKKDPSLKDQFDAKYGAGASDRILGIQGT